MICGPGYNPKEPQYRLGNPADLPEIDPEYEIYDPQISTTAKIYAFFVILQSNLLFDYAMVSDQSKSWGILKAEEFK